MSSLKERAPDMLHSIMAWLHQKGVRRGNPDSIKEFAAKEKKAECLKRKSVPVEGSGLLEKRLKRSLTIFL